MSQSWDDTVAASDDGTAILAEFFNRFAATQSSFSGASLPTDGDLEAGRISLQLDAGGSGYDHLKLYSDPDNGGDGWHGIVEYVPTNINYATATANAAGQLVGFGFQRTASDPTPSANNVGQEILHTGISKKKVVTDSSTIEVVCSGSNADMIPVELPLEAWTLGSTPPTAATVGTTPAMPALLFDATGETVSIGVRVPAGYSGDADLKLRLHFALVSTETAGDDINVTLDLVCVDTDSDEAVTQTSTQATVSHDLGATVTQDTVHTVELTIDYDDANNPVAAGDFLVLEFHLTNTTTVASVHFLGGQLLVPFGTGVFE